MTKKPIKFRATGKCASLDEIFRRKKDGEIPICPKCSSELVFALCWEEANKLDVHPGIFCPIDHNHFQVLLNLG